MCVIYTYIKEELKLKFKSTRIYIMCINAYDAYIQVYNACNVQYIEHELHLSNNKEDLEYSILMSHYQTTVFKNLMFM